MGGLRGAATSSAGTGTGNRDIVRYLAARERGLLRRVAYRGGGKPDLALELGEEKATLPVKNQSCELSGQSRATFLMTFSPDGTLIASTHGDHTVRVTDVQSGRCKHILTGHPRTPWCIAFHPSSNDILASGCLKGEVRIWDLRGGGSERWASEDGSVIASVTFHPTDQVLVIATSHELLFWDWTRPEPFARCKASSKYERVKWVKFDPLGHRLFTAIANTTVPREENPRGGVSYINRDTPNTEERRRLRQRYNHLVQQITTHQRDRILPGDPSGTSESGGRNVGRGHHDEEEQEDDPHPMEADRQSRDNNPPTSTSHIAGMTFSGPHHADMVIVEPQSPVHVEAVETAREYASMVTRNTAISLRNARQYAADVTSASLSAANEDVEREVIRVRNDHALVEAMDSDGGNRELVDADNNAYMDSVDQHHRLSEDVNRPSSVWERRRISSEAEAAQPSRHSSLSEQQLSTLLTSHTPLPQTRSHVQHRRSIMAMATPVRRERNEPQDTILGSLITSTQMSQVQPVSASSVSSTQTVPSSTSLAPVDAMSSGAFTSILRSRLTTTTVTSTHSSGLQSTCVSLLNPQTSRPSASASSTSTVSNISLLRSQLSHQAASTSASAVVAGTSGNTCTTHMSSAFSNASQARSNLSSAFTHPQPTSSTFEASSLGAVSASTAHTTTGSTNPSSTLQAILQNGPTAATATASSTVPGSDAARCLVCGHHAVYQSPNSASHHRHILHTPQPVPPPSSTSNTSLPSAIPSVTASSLHSSGASTFSSLTTTASTRSSRSGRSRRRMHNTHRLAAFFESEMRQAIDRVRSRQLDIRETLQALDQLQAETGVDAAAPTMPTRDLPAEDAGPMETSAEADATELNPALPSEELFIDNFNVNRMLDDTSEIRSDSVSSNGAAVPPSTSSPPPLPPTAAALQALAAAQATGTTTGGSQGTSAVTMLSSELNRRIDHLNQLERNVSEITHRLGARMRSLNEERRRDLGRLRNRISNTQYSLSSRLRERQERLRAHLDEIRRRYRATGAPRVIPEITITPSPDDNTIESSTGEESSAAPLTVSDAEAELRGLQESLGREESLTDMAQWNRNMNRDIEQMRAEMVRRRQRERERERTWHTLQRRHLHPHYAVSILDDTINRQNDGLQAAINRAIAGAFMGTGEAAVASNIVNLTHRIQSWDFTRFHIPDITDATSNVLVPHCKLHNDASVDISQDGRYLATFVPSHRGFPDDTILGVFSLQPETMGQCLFTKSFGPNAISLSLSPLTNYVLVGLAAKRLAWVFTPKQMVGQVYKLKTPQAGEDSMEHICDLMHPCDLDIRSHISVNSARWLPRVGEGVVYGTNRGDLHICRPGDDESDHKSARNVEADSSESHSIRRNIMQMLGIAVPSTTSTSTQTIHRLRRTASTQTDAPSLGDEP